MYCCHKMSYKQSNDNSVFKKIQTLASLDGWKLQSHIQIVDKDLILSVHELPALYNTHLLLKDYRTIQFATMATQTITARVEILELINNKLN